MTRRGLVLAIGGGVAVVSGIAAFLTLSRPDRAPPQPSLRISTGTFAEGPLSLVFGRNGLPEADAIGVTHALKGILDPRHLQDRDRYSLAFSTSGTFQQLSILRNLKEYSVHWDGSARTFRAMVADVAKSSTRKSASGRIRHSLWESFLDAGLSPSLVVAFADVFAWKIDFLTECHEGDRYALIWEEDQTGGGQISARRIIAAVYDGHGSGRKLAVRFKDAYYDEKGESLESIFLRAPLQYRRISSYFTKKRFHPILRIFRPHNGIDYAAPTGTPVSCVADGLVVFSGWKGGYGKYVEVRHGNSYITGYGHLSRVAKGVNPGVRIEQGQVIGNVGKTGLATGPHLDFSIRESGKYVNFLKLKFQPKGSIDRKQRSGLLSAATELIRILESQLGHADETAQSTGPADTSPTLLNADRSLLRKVNQVWTHPWLDVFFPWFTDLDHNRIFVFWVLPAVLAFCFYVWRGQAGKVILAMVLAVGLCDALCYRIIKPIVQRSRPEKAGVSVILRTGSHAGFSFPSNHAANAFAGATVLGMAVPGLRWWALAVAVLVAYSRVYVGVHFPADVVAGALLGVLGGVVVGAGLLRHGRIMPHLSSRNNSCRR